MFFSCFKSKPSDEEQLKICQQDRNITYEALQELGVSIDGRPHMFQFINPADKKHGPEVMRLNTGVMKAFLALGNNVFLNEAPDELTSAGKNIFNASEDLILRLFGDLREIVRRRHRTYSIGPIKREIKALTDVLGSVEKMIANPQDVTSFKQLTKHTKKNKKAFEGTPLAKNLVRLLGVFIFIAAIALIAVGIVTGGSGLFLSLGIAAAVISIFPPIAAQAFWGEKTPRFQEYQKVLTNVDSLINNRQSLFAKPVNTDSPSSSQPVQSLNNNRG